MFDKNGKEIKTGDTVKMNKTDLLLKNENLSNALSEMLALFSDEEFTVTQEQKEKWVMVWFKNTARSD